MRSRQRIVSIGVGVLGVAMIVIGGLGGLVPPVLTGLGFGLLAWGHWPEAAG